MPARRAAATAPGPHRPGHAGGHQARTCRAAPTCTRCSAASPAPRAAGPAARKGVSGLGRPRRVPGERAALRSAPAAGPSATQQPAPHAAPPRKPSRVPLTAKRRARSAPSRPPRSLWLLPHAFSLLGWLPAALAISGVALTTAYSGSLFTRLFLATPGTVLFGDIAEAAGGARARGLCYAIGELLRAGLARRVWWLYPRKACAACAARALLGSGTVVRVVQAAHAGLAAGQLMHLRLRCSGDGDGSQVAGAHACAAARHMPSCRDARAKLGRGECRRPTSQEAQPQAASTSRSVSCALGGSAHALPSACTPA